MENFAALKFSTFRRDCESFLSYMFSERYSDVTVTDHRCAVQRNETSKIEDKYSLACHLSSFQSSGLILQVGFVIFWCRTNFMRQTFISRVFFCFVFPWFTE